MRITKHRQFRTVLGSIVMLTIFALMGALNSSVFARSSVSDAALRASLQRDIDAYLRARGSAEHVSASSLCVSLPGHAAINATAGTSRYGGATSLPPKSLWQIGSNTKAFTATMMLQLEAEHKLSIRDTVGKWLPQYPAWSNITIQQLLNMTSGIATYDDRPAFLAAYAAAPTNTFSAVRLVSFAKGIPLQSSYHYTNTGYVMAEMIVEKATKDSYAHQLAQRFFTPLGLSDIYYTTEIPPSAVTERMPAGYFFDPSVEPFAALLGKDVDHQTLSWARSAGGIVASMEDLTTWSRALYEGRLLPPDSKKSWRASSHLGRGARFR